MGEPLTSNLVAELRRYVDLADWSRGRDWCEKAADEIERLTAELAQLRACFVNDPLGTSSALREALQGLIDAWYGNSETRWRDAMTTAKRALAGAAVETSDVQMVMDTRQILAFCSEHEWVLQMGRGEFCLRCGIRRRDTQL